MSHTLTPLQEGYVDAYITKHAKDHPDRTAIAFQNNHISYHQLDGYINNAVDILRRKDVSDGDHVAIFLNNSDLLVIVILACLRAGMIAIPVNTKYHPETISYILEDSEAKLLITDARGASQVDTENCFILERDAILSGRTHNNTISKRHWTGLALIFYTSGSTGRPKGVMISHQNLMHGIDSVTQYLSLRESQRLASILPFTFDAGLNFMLSGLSVGAENHILNYVFPKSLISDLERLSIQGLLLVPPVYHQIQKSSETVLKEMEFCASTGGSMATSLVDDLKSWMPNMQFFVMYGLTEAFRSTYLHPTDFDRKRGSIGKPIPHAYVQIVDENGAEVPRGTLGEIVHSGPLVGLGYWHDAEKTAQRYKNTPVHSPYAEDFPTAVYSGDHGWQDEDGFFYFAGRKDRLIKSRGFRIAPEEIEKVIAARTGIKQNYVFGRKHDAWGQEIIAVLEGPPSKKLQDILKKIKPDLGSYMLPDQILFVRSFPINSNGKIDGKKLIEELGDDV